MGQHVYRFLEEFPNEDPEPALATVRPLRPRLEPVAPESSQAVARIAEAYARGYEEGQLSARSEARLEMDALVSDYQLRMERTVALFSERLADELSDKLRRQIEALQATIADEVATALAPIVRHALTAAAVRELASGLGVLCRDNAAVTVELRGPKELTEGVWQQFCLMERLQQGAHPEVRFSIDESCDVLVMVNDSVIESQLMRWIAHVEEAVR